MFSTSTYIHNFFWGDFDNFLDRDEIILYQIVVINLQIFTIN